MFRKIFCIFLSFILINFKLEVIEGLNASSSAPTSANVTYPTSAQPVSNTTTLPGTTSPQVSQSSTRPPTTNRPTLPSASDAKRTYRFYVTLANYPWKDGYEKFLLMSKDFQKIYPKFNSEMKILFESGKFPDFKKLDPVSLKYPTELFINDAGKIRTAFMAMFDAVPPDGSKEPEIYIRLKNFFKDPKSNFSMVPYSIKVNEKVQGGVALGNWTSQGEIPDNCCGEPIYQTRTCAEPSSGTCDGLHLNRTFQCFLTMPLKCGKVRKFSFNMTLAEPWKDGYAVVNSSEFKKLIGKLTTEEGNLYDEVQNIFKKSSTGYKEIDPNSLVISQDKDKVGISFAVLFNELPSNPEEPEAVFLFKTESGKLGKFEIDTKSIKIEEHTPVGYTLTGWSHKASGCDQCCGGEIIQTRSCQSTMNLCPSIRLQLKRTIRCKHVCSKVKCGDSSRTVPYVMKIIFCFLVSSFFLT